jgi:hypothetical protein
MDKLELQERLRKRIAEAKAEREHQKVHPKECKCGGYGNIPQAQFSMGYVRCEG